MLSKSLFVLIACVLCMADCRRNPLGLFDEYEISEDDYSSEDLNVDTSQNRPSRQWQSRPISSAGPDAILFPSPVAGRPTNNPGFSQPSIPGVGGVNPGNNGGIPGVGGNPNAQLPTTPPQRQPCNCVTTEEYNPVCGSDNQTYSNPGNLQCTNRCGRPTTLQYYGVCRTIVGGRG